MTTSKLARTRLKRHDQGQHKVNGQQVTAKGSQRRPSRRYASVNPSVVEMARRRRERSHVRDDGTEKVGYPSFTLATRAAELAMEKSPKVPMLEAYRCHVCGLYHVGQRPRWFAVSANVDEALWAELGERVVGCLRAENHPNVRRRAKVMRQRLESALRHRDVPLAVDSESSVASHSDDSRT